MAVAHRYVRTDGNNANNGTTAALAWATLDYAASQDYSGNADGTDIHVAPGTYRETVVVDFAGASGRVTRFLADPENLWFGANAKPGRVRVTDANSSEQHANGGTATVITCNKDYVEFHDFYIDSSYYGVNFTAQGTGRALYRCRVDAGMDGVRYGSLVWGCRVRAGFYALRESARVVNSSLRSGLVAVFGGIAGLQIILDNSTISGNVGARINNGTATLTCRNTKAIYCATAGFQQLSGTLNATDCRAVFCQSATAGTISATRCYASGVETLGAFTTGGGTDISENDDPDCTSYVAAAGTGGFIGQGDNTGPAFTAADTDISGHRLRLRGGTVLDIGPTAISSPTDLPGGMLDWTTYKIAAPSVQIVAAGDVLLQVPAAVSVPVRVAVWVRHDSITGNKPQIVLRGDSITEQTATATAGDATWEQLVVTATPTIDEVLTLVFRARNSAGTCRFSDAEVIA
jgi:hypothetical protein